MTAARHDDGIDPACRLGEHRYCSGNLDIKPGPGPAVPLTRCACHCHRGQVTLTQEDRKKGRR
ncbi:hypothetical protein ACWEP4_26735 [Streptomyces sp. NPDC004227]